MFGVILKLCKQLVLLVADAILFGLAYLKVQYHEVFYHETPEERADYLAVKSELKKLSSRSLGEEETL